MWQYDSDDGSAYDDESTRSMSSVRFANTQHDMPSPAASCTEDPWTTEYRAEYRQPQNFSSFVQRKDSTRNIDEIKSKIETYKTHLKRNVMYLQNKLKSRDQWNEACTKAATKLGEVTRLLCPEDCDNKQQHHVMVGNCATCLCSNFGGSRSGTQSPVSHSQTQTAVVNFKKDRESCDIDSCPNIKAHLVSNEIKQVAPSKYVLCEKIMLQRKIPIPNGEINYNIPSPVNSVPNVQQQMPRSRSNEKDCKMPKISPQQQQQQQQQFCTPKPAIPPCATCCPPPPPPAPAPNPSTTCSCVCPVCRETICSLRQALGKCLRSCRSRPEDVVVDCSTNYQDFCSSMSVDSSCPRMMQPQQPTGCCCGCGRPPCMSCPCLKPPAEPAFKSGNLAKKKSSGKKKKKKKKRPKAKKGGASRKTNKKTLKKRRRSSSLGGGRWLDSGTSTSLTSRSRHVSYCPTIVRRCSPPSMNECMYPNHTNNHHRSYPGNQCVYPGNYNNDHCWSPRSDGCVFYQLQDSEDSVFDHSRPDTPNTPYADESTMAKIRMRRMAERSKPPTFPCRYNLNCFRVKAPEPRLLRRNNKANCTNYI